MLRGIIRIIKKFGRLFILLRHCDVGCLEAESILVIDSGNANQMSRLMFDLKNKYKKTWRIAIMAREDRKDFYIREHADIELIFPAVNARIFRIPRQVARFRNERFDLLVLTKLDIITIFTSVMFYKVPILLNNVWGEWYRIRLRNISELGLFSDDTLQIKARRPIKGEKQHEKISIDLSYIFKIAYSIFMHVYLIIDVTLLLVKTFIKNMLKV